MITQTEEITVKGETYTFSKFSEQTTKKTARRVIRSISFIHGFDDEITDYLNEEQNFVSRSEFFRHCIRFYLDLQKLGEKTK